MRAVDRKRRVSELAARLEASFASSNEAAVRDHGGTFDGAKWTGDKRSAEAQNAAAHFLVGWRTRDLLEAVRELKELAK